MSQQITDQNFDQEVLKVNIPILVDFYADWCGPCKMMAPIIEELIGEMKNENIKIFKMNVDEQPQTAEKFGIMSIPTTMLFKDGQEKERLVGLQSKETLKEIINKYK